MSVRVGLRSPLAGLALAVTLLGGVSCGGDNGPSKVTITDFIAGVTDVGATISAVHHGGAPPASSGAQVVNVTGGSTLINGGSAQITVAAATGNFTDVFVTVEGAEGYYQLTFPATVTVEDLLLTAAQHLPRHSFNISYGIGSGGGVGGTHSVPVSVVPVGAGDIQVSVSWDAESDVDLHVVQPDAEEVYYGNTTSAAGGQLDLDSNAGCSIDHVKNENITYPNPPSGTYVVRVDYYDSCTVGATNYVVTVQRKGHPPQTFTGQFTGTGDGGAAGSGTTITNFAYP